MASTEPQVDEQTVNEIVSEWPEEPAEIANTVRDRYGTPDEAAPSELLWYDTGPFKRTELYRDGVPHNFPKKHTDYLKQVIDFQVPPDRVDDLTQFDGSVYVDRTNGELAAKCDSEAANLVALNLAHDVVAEGKDVDEARQEYAVTMVKDMLGAEPDYARDLQFDVPEDKQRDPDESIITDAMREEVKEELGMDDEQAS